MKILNNLKVLLLLIFVSTTTIAAQNMPMQQIAPADSVTDSEIKQFVLLAQKLQAIQMEADKLIIAKLEEEGMSTQRFQEIMQSMQDPQSSSVTLSTEEEKTVANMQTFLQELSTKAQQDQMASVQNSDMSQERFQSIAQAMQMDKNLMMRFQEIATEMGSN
jgi:flavorubredoxin